MRSPAVKRLMKEAQELHEPTELYACHPLEDNLFEWHFTIRGPADSEFEGGLYHGRIILPPEYPMKPPSIIILTPNGRFEINKKICLSISGHHPESWQPSWSLRTAMLAIIGFMPTHGAGALGSLDYTPEERKVLAKRSQDFVCPSCGSINNILKPVTEESKKTSEEAKQLAAQMDFKDEKEKNAALKSRSQEASTNEEIQSAETTDDTSTEQSQPQFSPQSTFSPPFGQFPFRMPFPPFPQSFAPNASTTTNPAAQVPRFPLPFVSPFFPPMMQPGRFPCPPILPGMQVPPWQPGTSTPPFSPPAGESSQNSVRDTTQSSSASTSARQTNYPEPQPEPRTESSTVPTETVGSSTSARQGERSTEGVRHRNVASAGQGRQHAWQPQSAELQERQTTRGERMLLLFAAFVIIVIALLLIRRLHMMKFI